MAFSPDERLVVTGTSADRSGEGGALVFFDFDSRALVRRVGMPASVVALQWHGRLNQIFLGVGEQTLLLDSVNGDPSWASVHGAPAVYTVEVPLERSSRPRLRWCMLSSAQCSGSEGAATSRQARCLSPY